jgi:hypothetical protein
MANSQSNLARSTNTDLWVRPRAMPMDEHVRALLESKKATVEKAQNRIEWLAEQLLNMAEDGCRSGEPTAPPKTEYASFATIPTKGNWQVVREPLPEKTRTKRGKTTVVSGGGVYGCIRPNEQWQAYKEEKLFLNKLEAEYRAERAELESSIAQDRHFIRAIEELHRVADGLPYGLKTKVWDQAISMAISNSPQKALLHMSTKVAKLPKLQVLRKLGLDAHGDQISQVAKETADHILGFVAVSQGDPVWLKATVRLVQETMGIEVAGDTLESQIKRCVDPDFYRKKIRSALRQARETAHLHLAPTHISYCSNDGIAEYKSSLEAQTAWAESVCLQSSTGEKIAMPTPAQTARNRYAQLVATTKGMEKLAAEQGMVAQIITITMDGKYHPTTTYESKARRENPKYNGATPRESHNWLNEQWARARKKIDRIAETMWVVGVQPMADGTPHWHIVLWTSPEDQDRINAVIREYFKTNTNKHQLDFKQAKSASGASAYAMRMLGYVTRQTARQTTTKGQEKTEAQKVADANEALAASAWASAHGIRRYRTSHTKTTIWKMCRKEDVAIPAELREVVKAGDFATFYKMATAMEVKIAYQSKEGRYGDWYKRPAGLEYTARETGEICMAWAHKTWTIELKSTLFCDSCSQEPRACLTAGSKQHLWNKTAFWKALKANAPPDAEEIRWQKASEWKGTGLFFKDRWGRLS